MALSALMSVTAMIVSLGLVAVLAALLIGLFRWNSEAVKSSLEITATAKEHTRWFQRFSELLRTHEERLASMESSQRLIAEAIRSAPDATLSAAKERAKLAMQPSGPPIGSIEIPSEEEIRSRLDKLESPSPETPAEKAVGRAI